jgi:hypothetical protein
MTYTPDINLGNMVITGCLAAIGYGLRKLYTLLDSALDAQQQALDDIDDHAEVINLHSNVLIDGGLVKGSVGLPRVEERRRRSRIYSGQHVSERKGKA